MTANATAGFTRAAREDELLPDSMLGVMVDGDRVCLVRHDDEVFALEDRCTHALFPLSRGELLPDGTIECAWHGAKFDMDDGERLEGPAPEGSRLMFLSTRVEDGALNYVWGE